VTAVSAHPEGVRVQLDAGGHSIDAIQRAAYRLCDRLSVEVTSNGDNWSCLVTSVDGCGPDPIDVADFRVEVIDQVLRERIRDSTEQTRNMILSLAFSGLVDQAPE